MPKLSQILAVKKTIQSNTNREFTDIYHEMQRQPVRLAGIARTYQPRDDDGDKLPPESTLVQLTVEGVLAQTAKILTRLFDVTLTNDTANQQARADVVVNGETLLADVPVSYLLFLEKQLTDVHTVLSKVPVLDPSEQWHLDPNQNVYVTEPIQTVKTKKVPRNHVKAPATDKHPAQVEMYYEDVPVGDWTTIKSSGALPAVRKVAILERVEMLREAVKFAREQANTTEAPEQHAGQAIFTYLFAEPTMTVTAPAPE